MADADPAPLSLGEVRRVIHASPDPRVARTREAIVKALESLETGGTALSVSSLAREAGISRSAFYTHFSGLDELALFILSRAFDEIGAADIELRRTQTLSGAQTARRSLTLLTQHLDRHRALYANVFAAPVSARAHLAAIELFAAETRAILPYTDAAPDAVDAEAVTAFVAAGVMGLLGSWLRGDVVMDADRLVDHLMMFIPAWMAADQ
ncbi:TetR/AcrR family transcriptional regulator [Phytohabitans sp. ZYX-F-186]|uniref:TetR/AcrR family transcriptional regulator n=1 Tax=Phytohabitans maris TaxID=3071409 RepID=A0ABU0ZEM5_9ACTN|nr:TetR/AcrR family transcriptional regulator [Phytohabitans sp. ZYX-F-186]MDQ7904802.1 TetR/AcrR family transcriptional regulator [Phytohabitans sp. ZYX-F-186]